MIRPSHFYALLAIVAIALPTSNAAASDEDFLLIAGGEQVNAIGAQVSSSNSLGRKFTDNMQGCEQWVGDHLDVDDVRFARCVARSNPIPEPTAATLMIAGFLCFIGTRKRSRTRG